MNVKNVLLASLFLLMAANIAAQNEIRNKKPNIIMILIDDQDMNEIGTYGSDVYTPNMDRLAKEGINVVK